MLALVLLCLAVVELVFTDAQPQLDAVRVVAAVVPPVLVAFSRVTPVPATAVLIAVHVLDAIHLSPAGTLSAGFAWLAIVFGLTAWSRKPWPWLVALVIAGTVRDLRITDFDLGDVIVDWAFVGCAAAAGRMVHRRTAHADALASRLQLADDDREERAKEAVLRERGLLARELHDIVAHSVSLMVVQAATARPRASRVDQELADVLETIENSGRQALTELRRLLGVLRSQDSTDLQPVPDLAQLDELVERFRRAGMEVRTRLAVPEAVPAGVALCVYRTVQEGLTNALRYARGSPVDVTIVGDPRSIVVRVGDHGGISAPAGQLGSGTGLVGLRERVLLCRGRMTFGPQDVGHLLEVTLPMTDEAALATPAYAPTRPAW